MVAGGLVQRRTASSAASSGATGLDPPGAEGGLDRPDVDGAGYDDDGGDSKAMRLTLMEEVLLLGLKDREVRM